MFEKYIDREEVIKRVRESIAINSVIGTPEEGKPFGKGPVKALEHVLDLAKSMGFTTKNIDNVVGFVEYGKGDEMVAVLGHLDVVPAGNGWKCDPFDGDLTDTKIFGRGTLDDKGPMVGALFALKAIKDSGKPINKRIRLIFGTDEETGSRDMKRYKETEELPIMAFTPDADYPVIFSEKGLVCFTLEKKLSEPKNNFWNLIETAGGTVVNQVPDKAFIRISFDGKEKNFQNLKGLGAHGSTPEKGINAIDDVIEQFRKDESFIKACPELKKFVTFYCNSLLGDITGKGLGIDFFSREVGNSSLNIGILYGDCKRIGIKVDYRYPSGFDGDKIIRRLEKVAQENYLEFELIKNKQPLYISKDSSLVKILEKAYFEETGRNEEPIAIGGGTYAKTLPNTVAFGPIFPDQEDIIHQPNEFISIENLFKNISIEARAMYYMAR